MPDHIATVASDPVPWVIITGMSGAGRTSALHQLEDMGYQAIDNLPLAVVPALVEQSVDPNIPTALGVDLRGKDFSPSIFVDQIQDLRADNRFDVTVVFMDCEDDVLLRRFSETRRSHPLTVGRSLQDAIAEERRLLAPILEISDMTVDSVRLRPVDLRQLLRARFSLSPGPGMAVFVKSFSFRRGLPSEADLVFDVRFLRNPYWVNELRAKTGQDMQVADYIAQDHAWLPFKERLTGLISSLLALYEGGGKNYLTIAIGCTGGQHRSVFAAESLAALLREQGGDIQLSHRDLTG